MLVVCSGGTLVHGAAVVVVVVVGGGGGGGGGGARSEISIGSRRREAENEIMSRCGCGGWWHLFALIWPRRDQQA